MVNITQRKNNNTNRKNKSNNNTKKKNDLWSSDDDSESENEYEIETDSELDSADEDFQEIQKGGASDLKKECRYTNIKTVMKKISKLDQDILVDGLTVWAGFSKSRKLFKFKRWLFPGISVSKLKKRMIKLDKYFKCVAENKLPIENTKFNPDLLEELKLKQQIRIALALIFAACRTSKIEQASTQGVAEALIALQKALKPSETTSSTPATNKPGAEKAAIPATTSIDEGTKQKLISDFILSSPKYFYIVYDTDGKGKSELPFKPVNFAQVIELLYNKLVSRGVEKEKAKLRTAQMDAKQYNELQKIRTETQTALEKLPGQGQILDLKSEYTSIYTSYDTISKEYNNSDAGGYNKGDKKDVAHTEHIDMLNKVNSVLIRIDKFIVDYNKLSPELKTQLPTENENVQKMKVTFGTYKLNIESKMKISNTNTIPTNFTDINQLKTLKTDVAKLFTPVEIQKMGTNIRFIPVDAFKALSSACIDVLTAEQISSLKKDIFIDLSDEFIDRMVNYLEVVSFTPGGIFSNAKLDDKAVSIINLANNEGNNLFTKLLKLFANYQDDVNSNLFKFLVAFPDLKTTPIGIKILSDASSSSSRLALQLKGSITLFKKGQGYEYIFRVNSGTLAPQNITAELIKDITPPIFALIEPDKFRQILPSAFTGVDASKAAVMTENQAEKLTQDQLANLSADALNALTKLVVQKITATHIKSIHSTTFKDLTIFLTNMSDAQVNEIQQPQFLTISDDVNKLDKITEFGSIQVVLFQSIPKRLITRLNDETIAKITDTQIARFDINVFDPNKFAFLSTKVFTALETTQAGEISTQQMTALCQSADTAVTTAGTELAIKTRLDAILAKRAGIIVVAGTNEEKAGDAIFAVADKIKALSDASFKALKPNVIGSIEKWVFSQLGDKLLQLEDVQFNNITDNQAAYFTQYSPIFSSLNAAGGTIAGKILAKCSHGNQIKGYINRFCDAALSGLGSTDKLIFVKGIITELHTNGDAAFADAIITELTGMGVNLGNFADSDNALGVEVGKLMIKSAAGNANNSVAFIAAVAPGAAAAAAAAAQAFITSIFDTITTIGNHIDEAVCAAFANAFLQQHTALATAAILAVPNINQSFAKLIYAAGANLEQKAFVKYAAIAAILRTEAVPAGGAAAGGSIQEKIERAPYSVPNAVALTYKQVAGAPALAAPAAANAFAQYTDAVPAAGAAAAAGAADQADVVRLINAIKHAAGAPAGADALFTALYGAVAAADPTAVGNLPVAVALPFAFANRAQIQQFMNTAGAAAAAVADSIVNHIATTEDPFQAGGSKNRSYRIRKLKKSKTNNKKSKKYHSRKQNHRQNNKLNNNKKYSVKNKSTKHHKTKRH